MNSICFNGKIISGAEPVLMASNRGYRYGDGLFETMKVLNGRILLADYHFERLFTSISLLKYEIPRLVTKEKLEQDILHLCKRNGCEKLARVRLSVFRGNGGLYDDDEAIQYLVECWPLNESATHLNENGLVIDVYPDAKKSCDKFSNLKSANFLPYTLAARYAKKNKLNDCLILNTAGSIADSTIANVFIFKNDVVITPGLESGCINGVMRRHLLTKLPEFGYEVREKSVLVTDFETADEIFLTNAVNGIRWVKQFKDKYYTNAKTVEIYSNVVKSILL